MPGTERFSIEAALGALDATAASVVRQKLSLVRKDVERMSQGGFSLRDDSRLAYLFCTEALPAEWTHEEVVHELMCIQYISQNTQYPVISQSALRQLAQSLKEETGASWTDVWNTVATLGADAVKYACMDAARLRLPEFTEKRRWADMEDE